MFRRGSKFYSKISSGGSIFFKKFVPGGGTNFGGSICRDTYPEVTAYKTVHSTPAEKELKYLRKENRKTMFIAVAVMILSFIIYMVFFHHGESKGTNAL